MEYIDIYRRIAKGLTDDYIDPDTKQVWAVKDYLAGKTTCVTVWSPGKRKFIGNAYPIEKNKTVYEERLDELMFNVIVQAFQDYIEMANKVISIVREAESTRDIQTLNYITFQMPFNKQADIALSCMDELIDIERFLLGDDMPAKQKEVNGNVMKTVKKGLDYKVIEKYIKERKNRDDGR